MMARWIAVALAALLLAALAPSAAQALERREGERAGVAAGETVDGDLFLTGETLVVAGRVTGDVYAMGQTVTVTGQIDGDLMAAGQSIAVEGSLAGDLRAAAGRLDLRGSVGRNVTWFGQVATLAPVGQVGGSWLGFGETQYLQGRIARAVTAGGSKLELAGPIGGSVEAWVEELTLAPNARVSGDVTYTSPNESFFPPGSVGGQVTRVSPERATQEGRRLSGLATFLGVLLLLGNMLVGSVLVWFFPKLAARGDHLVRRRPLPALAIGLAALIFAPFAMLFLGITIIGLPLAIAVLVVYLVGIWLGWLVVGLTVGGLVAQPFARGRAPAAALLLALGLLVLHLATSLPIIGDFVVFAVVCLGLGTSVLLMVNASSRENAPPAEVV